LGVVAVNASSRQAQDMDTIARLMVRAYLRKYRETLPQDLDLKRDVGYVGGLNPKQAAEFLELANF